MQGPKGPMAILDEYGMNPGAATVKASLHNAARFRSGI